MQLGVGWYVRKRLMMEEGRGGTGFFYRSPPRCLLTKHVNDRNKRLCKRALTVYWIESKVNSGSRRGSISGWSSLDKTPESNHKAVSSATDLREYGSKRYDTSDNRSLVSGGFLDDDRFSLDMQLTSDTPCAFSIGGQGVLFSRRQVRLVIVSFCKCL